METQPSLKISIPVPCHEDWNKMTPNEKGAFCGKCCKTVVDFSNKTPGEIRDILIAQSGKKICGRFKSHQVEEPEAEFVQLNVPYHLLPKNISYRRAFALALFFVFGTTLFSCRTAEDHVVGDIAVINNIDTPLVENHLMGDTTYVHPPKEVTKPECTVKGEVKMQHPMGEVAIIKDTVKTQLPDTVKDEPIMGKVKLDE